MVATVAKKKRRNNNVLGVDTSKAASPPTINLALHVGSGRTVTLDGDNLTNLNEQEQMEALSQLLLMQNDIASKVQLLQQQKQK